MLPLQPPPAQFLMFLPKAEAVLLLLVTSGVLFQSMLPLNAIEFVSKDAVDVLGSVRTSLILNMGGRFAQKYEYEEEELFYSLL